MIQTAETEMMFSQVCRWLSSGLLSGINTRCMFAGRNLLHKQDYLLETSPHWNRDGTSETVNHYGCEMIQGVEAFRSELFAENTPDSIWLARALPQWFGRLNTTKQLTVYQRFQLAKNHDYWRTLLQERCIAGGAFYEFSAPFVDSLTKDLVYEYDCRRKLEPLESTKLTAVPNIRICLGKWSPDQVVEWARSQKN